jgi:hypothetical protein
MILAIDEVKPGNCINLDGWAFGAKGEPTFHAVHVSLGFDFPVTAAADGSPIFSMIFSDQRRNSC